MPPRNGRLCAGAKSLLPRQWEQTGPILDSPGPGQGGMVGVLLGEGYEDQRDSLGVGVRGFFSKTPRDFVCISTLHRCTLPDSEKPEGFWEIHPSCW